MTEQAKKKIQEFKDFFVHEKDGINYGSDLAMHCIMLEKSGKAPNIFQTGGGDFNDCILLLMYHLDTIREMSKDVLYVEDPLGFMIAMTKIYVGILEIHGGSLAKNGLSYTQMTMPRFDNDNE